jgi:hypothetical protein
MLNQATMLQHFLIPTASNGLPLSVLLRRDFARGGSLEQTGRAESTEKTLRSRTTWGSMSAENPHACQCLVSAACFGVLSPERANLSEMVGAPLSLRGRHTNYVSRRTRIACSICSMKSAVRDQKAITS